MATHQHQQQQIMIAWVLATISYEKGIELKAFWQGSLLHEFFDITSKEHAVK
jgi:hypothetical protein